MRKSFIFMGVFVILFGWIIRDNVFAYTPVELYDNVWRLINTKFVDQTNNAQDWSKWRHKYDNYIRTNEDAYVAINTMVASLNDPYTKFMDPKEFAEETSSIKGSLKGIGIQIGVKDGKLMVIAPIEDTPAEKAGLESSVSSGKLGYDDLRKASERIGEIISLTEEKENRWLELSI